MTDIREDLAKILSESTGESVIEAVTNVLDILHKEKYVTANMGNLIASIRDNYQGKKVKRSIYDALVSLSNVDERDIVDIVYETDDSSGVFSSVESSADEVEDKVYGRDIRVPIHDALVILAKAQGSVPEPDPAYYDTDKATVIELDENLNRTGTTTQISVAPVNPLRNVKTFLKSNSSKNYDVVLGKDFLKTSTDAFERVANYAFSGCTNLIHAEIYCEMTNNGAYRITQPGASFFEGCTNLQSCRLLDAYTTLSEYMFDRCVNLDTQKFKFPKSLTTIDTRAFYRATSVTDVEIPASVTTIDESAFEACTNLQKITIKKPENSIDGAPWTWSSWDNKFNPENVTVVWTG